VLLSLRLFGKKVPDVPEALETPTA
jgi:hypothetical protein